MGRRAVLAGTAACAIAAAIAATGVPAAAERHPAVAFMHRARAVLLKAARSGSTAQFLDAILRYADVPGIADYSLGRYGKGLPTSKRKQYQRGVALFMARYFASQAREYQVVDADIDETPRIDGDTVLVDSRIRLKDGRTYTVRWSLRKQRGGYRINNVRVLGFWLAYFQRAMFVDHIRSHGGNVESLIAALSR